MTAPSAENNREGLRRPYQHAVPQTSFVLDLAKPLMPYPRAPDWARSLDSTSSEEGKFLLRDKHGYPKHGLGHQPAELEIQDQRSRVRIPPGPCSISSLQARFDHRDLILANWFLAHETHVGCDLTIGFD